MSGLLGISCCVTMSRITTHSRRYVDSRCESPVGLYSLSRCLSISSCHSYSVETVVPVPQADPRRPRAGQDRPQAHGGEFDSCQLRSNSQGYRSADQSTRAASLGRRVRDARRRCYRQGREGCECFFVTLVVFVWCGV